MISLTRDNRVLIFAFSYFFPVPERPRQRPVARPPPVRLRVQGEDRDPHGGVHEPGGGRKR